MTIQKKDINTRSKIIPVILSGGSGTRLWPLSRACLPKQYLKVKENSNFSLLQNTFLRLIGLKNLENPIIICNQEQRFIAAEHMREIDIKPHAILLEPVGKNTAPAIALSALIAKEHYEDPLLLVLSSDHEIKNSNKLREAILKGSKFAESGRLVTFGIKTTSAETNYGYIESEEELSSNHEASNIKSFFEKPDLDNANKFLSNDRFTWNSGIFLFKASTIIKELIKFEPILFNLCKEAINDKRNDLEFIRIKEEPFKKCPNIPIDIAVMEKTNLGTVIFLDAGWSDLGSWKAVWEDSTKDDKGNSSIGKVIYKNSENCYFRSENRLIVGIGLNNLNIIETNDAILIADKESNQTVKELVSELDKKGIPEAKINKKMFRPWGSYTSLIIDKTWQVKKLEIKPFASISLQLHNCRSEHWVVVSGSAKVEISGKISLLEVNESIYVPLRTKHRLSNPGNTPLILIEVQSGSLISEDDILRFDDIYGRVDK